MVGNTARVAVAVGALQKRASDEKQLSSITLKAFKQQDANG